MELYTLKINVTNQCLSFGENPPEIFSGDQSIDFVEFTFTDDTWNFPNIWAIFYRQKGAAYQIALDDNKVMIPAELMQKRGYVYIGLMATDGENVQTSSVLQYSIRQGVANVETVTPTPSIYEQFLADLDAYQEAIHNLETLAATAETLPAGLDATASYVNGVLQLGIPKGDTGATGNGIQSITKTGTSGNVDTYTITYTNGQTTTFTVTNGSVTSVDGQTGDVDLSNKANKVDLDNVLNILNFNDPIELDFTIESGRINYVDGTTHTSSSINHTDFIDIQDFDTLIYKRIKDSDLVVYAGLAFYDKNKVFIQGQACEANADAFKYNENLYSVSIPSNAKYVRFSTLSDTQSYGDFEAYGTSKLVAKTAPNTIVNEIVEHIEPINLINFNDSDFITGKYLLINSGSFANSVNYNTTGFIEINGGETYTYSYGEPVGTPQIMRFIAFYDSNKSILSGLGLESITSFTAPANAKYVRISANSTNLNENDNTVMLFKGTSIIAYSKYFDPYYIVKHRALNNNNLNITVKADDLSANTQITIAESIDSKKNTVIEFIGYFDSFTSLTVGHGYNVSYGNYAVIDDTQITVYYNNPPQQVKQESHGLNIADFIHVIISQNNNARADITIMTSNGDYKLENSSWLGCNGNIFALSETNMTEVVANAVFNDFNSDLFLFGDSYITIGNNERYPYYLIQSGYTDLYIDGYSGRNSTRALISFNNVIFNAKPKFAIWTLGMNDGDSVSSINSSWLACVESFISTCEKYDVIPILATIPNCPNVRNTFKNNYVRQSGYRYIDFAKAVGAEEAGSTWYPGMLSNDNTHPSLLGAKALYTRFITDVPEVIK